MQQDPLSGHLFAFINRRATQIKVLYFDRSGLCVWPKRLEQGRLGESFAAIPEVVPPNKKTRVAGDTRASKPNPPTNGADESSLFFDEQKVPVEIINVPHPEVAGLGLDEYEVISEKISYRLAQ